MADQKPSPTEFVKQGLIGGLGYGVAVTLVHSVTGIGLIVALGMPPLTGFVVQAMLMEVLLGVAMGTLLSPLYKLPRAEWIHPIALALLWLIMERWVAVDPSKLQMWVSGPLIGLIVFGIGKAIWAKKPVAVPIIATAISVVALTVPVIIHMGRPAADESLGDLPAAAKGSPDVLVIVMDTVRAQSASAYGYERHTTPVLEKIATEGVIFKDANAPATWSLPAHASLFTGAFPSVTKAHGEHRYLDNALPTLAETLAAKGWDTYCFSANPHISDAFGLIRGFRHNDKAWLDNDGGRGFSFIFRWIDAVGLGGAIDKGGAKVVGNVQTWMDERPEDAPPAFVFVNFLEAHFPFHQLPDEFLYEYQQQPIGQLRSAGQIAFGVQFGRQLTDDEYNTVRQPLLDMYDAGVLYTDYLVGEIVDVWRKEGKLDNTIVVILGDHGEVMGEHGAFGHVTPMVEEDLRVPLLMRYPPRIPGGSEVEPAVTTLGMFASITDMAGVETPKSVQVGTLLPGIEGKIVGQPVISERFEEKMLADRFAPGTANGSGEQVNPRGRYRTLRKGPWKLVQHSTDGNFLFNLEQDPGELNDVAKTEYQALDELLAELKLVTTAYGMHALDAEIDSTVSAEMDEETRKALEALGYIEPEQ